ncbi:MAG: TonB-dependent receptor, partial [Halieaceae bacterium]
GDSTNQLTDGVAARLTQGDYRVTDAILTYEIDQWQARLFVNNISDERGITYEDSQDFDQVWGRNSSNVIRPRNFGISLRRFW